jgi:penicillin V acylase-like amidase (Ntn superfamily)
MAENSKSTDTPRKTVVFRDQNMNTSYCNVVNVAATSEEFALLIGNGRSWHGRGEEFEVDLNDRVIMTPQTAKRLAAMLVNAISQHENRYGTINAAAQPPAPEMNIAGDI